MMKNGQNEKQQKKNDTKQRKICRVVKIGGFEDTQQQQLKPKIPQQFDFFFLFYLNIIKPIYATIELDRIA